MASLYEEMPLNHTLEWGDSSEAWLEDDASIEGIGQWLSNIGSGIAAGAATGSVGGPVGAVVGGILGGGLGALQTALSQNQPQPPQPAPQALRPAPAGRASHHRSLARSVAACMGARWDQAPHLATRTRLSMAALLARLWRNARRFENWCGRRASCSYRSSNLRRCAPGRHSKA